MFDEIEKLLVLEHNGVTLEHYQIRVTHGLY